MITLEAFRTGKVFAGLEDDSRCFAWLDKEMHPREPIILRGKPVQYAVLRLSHGPFCWSK